MISVDQHLISETGSFLRCIRLKPIVGNRRGGIGNVNLGLRSGEPTLTTEKRIRNRKPASSNKPVYDQGKNDGSGRLFYWIFDQSQSNFSGLRSAAKRSSRQKIDLPECFGNQIGKQVSIESSGSLKIGFRGKRDHFQCNQSSILTVLPSFRQISFSHVS